jgi:phage gp46-like protein
MADLALIETGNGGDLRMRGADLAGVEGVENMPYLSMFSGEGWWGNAMLPPDAQFSSQTERVMGEVALNSAGRVRIEQAIRADLASIEKALPGTKVEVSTALSAADRLEISIRIAGEQFYYLWNPIEGTLTTA